MAPRSTHTATALALGGLLLAMTLSPVSPVDAQHHPAATPTPPPQATSTPVPVAGWHPPTTHEHGDQPPAWVLASANQPFIQTRESHTGYKGIRGQQTNNPAVESYLITHILSAESARSHGDHDYQLWVKDRQNAVSYWAGTLDFSPDPSNAVAPVIERTSDTGERPIVLSVGDAAANGGCETWYTRPGSRVFDLGWTICDRYQRFDGAVLGGTGLYRSSDWTLYPDRFGARPGAAPSLAAECRVEFGVCRLSFLRTGYASPGAGTVVPVN